ncbi:MAG: Asp23/Gls24 family envelope stress response protein [Actinomycetota bacterium]
MSEATSRSDEAQASTGQSQQAGTRGGATVPQPRRSTTPTGARASLTSETGTTHIADNVVSKIAALATREIPGVHSMGRGFSRRMGQLRAMVPGTQTEEQPTAQGVSVEVGEKEAAVDLDIVTYYGESIAEVADSVRRNVIDRVQGMTGLQVVEVNINVDDIYVEGEESSEEESRVS